MQTPYKDVWETYTACWSETNTEIRIKKLMVSLLPDCRYTDINIETLNTEGLTNYMEAFQKQFPGAKFSTTDFKEHHNQSLAHWNMINADGRTIGRGTSYASYENGKLRMMTGFFDQ